MPDTSFLHIPPVMLGSSSLQIKNCCSNDPLCCILPVPAFHYSSTPTFMQASNGRILASQIYGCTPRFYKRIHISLASHKERQPREKFQKTGNRIRHPPYFITTTSDSLSCIASQIDLRAHLLYNTISQWQGIVLLTWRKIVTGSLVEGVNYIPPARHSATYTLMVRLWTTVTSVSNILRFGFDCPCTSNVM